MFKYRFTNLMRKRSNFGNALISFDWRIDCKSRSRRTKDLKNEPTAIVELVAGNESLVCQLL